MKIEKSCLVLVISMMFVSVALAQNTNNYNQPYDTDQDTVFLFHTDIPDEGNADYLDNANTSVWGLWAYGITADPNSNRTAESLAAQFGTCIYFGIQPNAGAPGINNQISVAGGLEDYGTALTVEAWIRPIGVTGEQHLIHRQGCYTLQLNGNQVKFTLNFADASSIMLTTANANLQANQWYHVAGMWNGSEISVWVGENKLATATYTGKGPIKDPAASDYIMLGGAPWWSVNYVGAMDEIRISKTARLNLVPAELSAFGIE